MLKAGCKVKVRVRDKDWRQGKLIKVLPQGLNEEKYLCGVGEPHYFNYEERPFDRFDVKQYVELPEEQALATHLQEAQLAFALVQEAVAKLMPDEKVELVQTNAASGNVEISIVGYYGGVTLDPVIYEQETIGQVVERAAWQVTTWHSYPDTRTEPGGVDDCPIGTPTNYAQAAVLFVETLFKLKANDYWQNKADEAAAQAWAEVEERYPDDDRDFDMGWV